MELKEFVSETIKQVIDGVITAQEYATTKDSKVNPKLTFRTDQGMQMWEKATGQPIQSIEFDIAVTASEGSKAQGGVAVLIGVFGGGTKGQVEESSQKLNRIKFSVPISLPIAK
jgi:hypothetical protein